MGWSGEEIAGVAALLTAIAGFAGVWWSQRHQRRQWKTEIEQARETALDERDEALRADLKVVFERLEAENRRQNQELADTRARLLLTDKELQEKNQKIIGLIVDRANALHEHGIAMEKFFLERHKNIELEKQFGRRLTDAPEAPDADHL